MRFDNNLPLLKSTCTSCDAFANQIHFGDYWFEVIERFQALGFLSEWRRPKLTGKWERGWLCSTSTAMD